MKVFETPDGLQYQLFAGPVHYQGANGKWVEYKPDLTERTVGGTRSFHASGVPFTTGFTPQGDKHEVTFQHKGTGIRFQVEAESNPGAGAPVRSGRSLRFEKAAGQVAYEYELKKNGLKETILLLQPPTTNTFRFPIAFEGVTPQLQEDGSIAAVDEAGAIRWRIAAPFAVDDAGSRAPSVTQQVADGDESQTLVITVDEEWLRDPARQWPVQVDPTIVIEPDPADGMDVGVQENICSYERYKTNGLPTDELITLSHHYDLDTCSTKPSIYNWGLLKFSLSALPKGAAVKKAYLNFVTTNVKNSPVGTLAAVTTPWEESTVWSLKQLDAQVLYSHIPVPLHGWTQLDITTLTNRWISGDQPNYGVRIGAYWDGFSGRSYSFVTSDSADPTRVPHMIVELLEDRVPPTVTLDTTALTAAVRDTAPGEVRRVEVWVDQVLKGTWEGSSSERTITFSTLEGIDSGTHTVKVVAEDSAGLRSESEITTASLPMRPGPIMGRGMAGYRTQLVWSPLPTSGYRYNLYRGPSPSAVVDPALRIQTSMESAEFRDGPLPAGLYYYWVTAVTADGTESAPSAAIPVVAGAEATVTLGFHPTEVQPDWPYASMRTGGLADVNPNLPDWKKQTDAAAQLGGADGVTYEHSPLYPTVGRAVLSFPVLDVMNKILTATGQGGLTVTDLRALVTGSTLRWVGYGQAGSAYGANLLAWNETAQKYDSTTTVTASTPMPVEILLDATQTNGHLDLNGQYHAQGQTSAAVTDPSAIRLHHDHALLTVTLREEVPAYVDAAFIGNGQVLLAWDPSSPVVNLYRSESASFDPNAATLVAEEVIGSSFVDSPGMGEGVASTQYYHVQPVGSTDTKASQGVVVTTDLGRWLVIPNDVSGSSYCSTRSTPLKSLTGHSLSLLGGRDGLLFSAGCSDSYGEVRLYLDVLGFARRELNRPTLTESELRSLVRGLVVDATVMGANGSATLAGVGVSTPSMRRLLVANSNATIQGKMTITARARDWIKFDHIAIGFLFAPPLSPMLTANVAMNGVNLSWSDSGLYHVYRSTEPDKGFVQITKTPVASAYYDSAVVGGRTYYYRVQEADSPGLTPFSATASATFGTRREQDLATYSDGWTTATTSTASGGTYTQTTSGSATATFVGSGIDYIAPTGCFGMVHVSLDGGTATTISLYSSSSSTPQTKAFVASGLPYGLHTLNVKWGGYNNSSCVQLPVDAFDIYDQLDAPSVSAQVQDGAVQLAWAPVTHAQRYQVFRSYDGGFSYQPITSPITSTTFSDTPVIPVKYMVMAIAPEGKSITSSAVELAAGAGRYDDVAPGYRYDGSWQTVDSPESYALSLHVTDDPGAGTALHVGGSEVRFVGAKGPEYGIAEIMVDGAVVGTADLYSPTPLHQQELYRLQNLTGTPTVALRHSGTKNAVATGTAINLDLIEVLDGSQPQSLTAIAYQNRVELRWTGVANAVGYHIYRSTQSGGSATRLTTTPVSETMYTDTSVTAGTTYYYTVRAIDALGVESAPSNEAMVVAGGRQIGLDGRWPYVTMPWGISAGYLHLESGNMVIPFTDGVLPVNTMAMVVRRTYNSNDPDQHGLGTGWRLNMQQEIADLGDLAVWTDGDGSQTIFARQADGTYEGEPQVFDRLERLVNGWRVTRRDGTTLHFDEQGLLTALFDRNGNGVVYTLDGSLPVSMAPYWDNPQTPAVDPVLIDPELIVSFTYTSGLLRSVSLPSHDGVTRSYEYAYDATGHLVSVTDPTGAAHAYSYDDSGRMWQVTDPEGRTAGLEYKVGRVSAYVDGLGNRTTVLYLSGQTALTDPLGSQTVFSVNGQGRLEQVRDGLGSTTALQYDTGGNLVLIRDALGRETRAGSYDAWGNPGTVTDALGAQTTLRYDPIFHQVTESTDTLGRKDRITYDSRGNPLQVETGIPPLGAPADQHSVITRYTYDQYGRRARVTDPRGDATGTGFTTIYTYDSRGWLQRVTDPLGAETGMEYDAVGNLIRVTDSLGRVTQYTYDAVGRKAGTVLPDGATMTIQYDRSGYPVRARDPVAAETTYAYDLAGRLKRETNALGISRSYEYDAAGNLIATTDGRGNRWVRTYDALGRMVAETNPEGETMRFAYDLAGNQVRVTLPGGREIHQTYDALNRPIARTTAVASTELVYDAVGNLIRSTDENGHHTLYEYDNLNRLFRVYDALNVDTDTLGPKAGAVFTQYGYDDAGNRVVVRNALGNETHYQYDALSRLVTETDPLGGLKQYYYDAVGQMVQLINENGAIYTYTYDLRGNLTEQMAESQCARILYEYDLAGRKVAVHGPEGSTGYRYDPLGRLVEHVDPYGNVTQYGYDENGNRSRLSLREESWAYEYDRANRLVRILAPGNSVYSYSYNVDGQPVQIALGVTSTGGQVASNVYDPVSGRLVKQTGQMLGGIEYSYDAKGNVTQYNVGYTSSRTVRVTYQYDALDRLVQSVTVDDTYSSSDPTTTVTYEYDAVGNRVESISTPRNITGARQVTTTYEYDAANRILSTTAQEAGYASPIETARYVYDAAGRLLLVNGSNILGIENSRYEYDAFDRLIKVVTGTNISTFGYDGDGRRLFRKNLDRNNLAAADTVYYQYAGTQVVAERDGTGQAKAFVTRGAGDRLLGLHVGGESYIYTTDRLGSVLQLSGKGTNTYRYDDFGNPVEITGTLENDWQFTGTNRDSLSGLYHLGARYYHPADGRFLTQDTYKGSAWDPSSQNLYTYVSNNPVNFVDPTGHAKEDREEGAMASGSAVAESKRYGDIIWAKLEDGNIVVLYSPVEKTVDKIHINPDGTYTLQYTDGSFDYVKDWEKAPGKVTTHSACVIASGATSVCVSSAFTDSDGTVAPAIGLSWGVEPVSYGVTFAEYDGDPRSLQHIQMGYSASGIAALVQGGFDLNTGHPYGNFGLGSPQFSGGVMLPLPLVDGPPVPQAVNPNYAQLVQ